MVAQASANAHGTSDMVTQVVTMVVKPEHEREFLAFAAYVEEEVHANEPGVLLYVLTKHPTEPQTYLWIERYRDREVLEAHASPQPFLSSLEGLDWRPDRPQ